MKKCKKVSFSDEKMAILYIEKLKKTSKRSLKPVNSYLCPKCLNWHLTKIESLENMQIKYKDRQIEKLKEKIQRLENEIKVLRM